MSEASKFQGVSTRVELEISKDRVWCKAVIGGDNIETQVRETTDPIQILQLFGILGEIITVQEVCGMFGVETPLTSGS